MLTYPIEIEGLKGVGSVVLNLQENQRVYTLIGANGVSKTKTLEALFQVLLATNEAFANDQTSQVMPLCFREIQHILLKTSSPAKWIGNQLKSQFPSHQLPIMFV